MSETNEARQRIWPDDDNVLVRFVSLYVGQGDSSLVLIADGNSYRVFVVDINKDHAHGGIDVPRLVEDLLLGGSVSAFVNTHPHDDHLRGIGELSDAVTINEVWHSGHIPSEKHGNCYQDLVSVIKKVCDDGGSEVVLEGSRSAKSIGDAQYYVLAPAEYVTDEVNEEDADKRRARIHEQCAVLKFGNGDDWVIVTGDADRAAFENHIMYHKDRLGAAALSASHHGSRTFFRASQDQEPYLDALDAIDPTDVIVSAPTQEESPHDHPHDDAMQIYRDKVGKDRVFHTGEERHSYIIDIYRDGGISDVQSDDGELAATYALEDDDGDDDGGKKMAAVGPFIPPKSRTGDVTPRKYGL